MSAATAEKLRGILSQPNALPAALADWRQRTFPAFFSGRICPDAVFCWCFNRADHDGFDLLRTPSGYCRPSRTGVSAPGALSGAPRTMVSATFPSAGCTMRKTARHGKGTGHVPVPGNCGLPPIYSGRKSRAGTGLSRAGTRGSARRTRPPGLSLHGKRQSGCRATCRRRTADAPSS